MSQPIPARLTAFVGRSFLEADKQLWHDLRDVLDTFRPMGLAFEDAKEAQPRPVSEKVRELILGNDIYIGLLTRRYPIYEPPTSVLGRSGIFNHFIPSQWTTSEWVVEEIGFAIGKDRPVILLIEQGVVFPTADLDADTEWIRFDRHNISTSQSALTTMLSTLIAKRVTTLIPPGGVTGDAPPAEPPLPREAPKAEFGAQLIALRQAVSTDRIVDAERIHNEILSAETEESERNFVNLFLLGQRARSGDGSALAKLKAMCAQEPLDFSVLLQLFDAFISFNQFHAGFELLIQNSKRIQETDQSALVINAASALRKDGKPRDALNLTNSRIVLEKEEANRVRLLRAAAYSAQDLSETDLEAALLEKALQLDPTDNDTRFRLAYLYGDSVRPKLAAYHYELLSHKVDWPNVLNNLAAAFGELGLNASQVDGYSKVADRHDLSKANLANLYAEAGFLATADELANRVVSSDDKDANAKARARVALTEALNMRRKEEEEISKIPVAVRDERQFMIDFADAYSTAAPPIQATFNTPHGQIELRIDGQVISGNGQFSREYKGGLLALALRDAGRTDGSYTRDYRLKLSGTTTNSAGKFELKILTYVPGSASPESTRKIEGLLIVSGDGTQIRFLEREDKRREVVAAKKVQ